MSLSWKTFIFSFALMTAAATEAHAFNAGYPTPATFSIPSDSPQRKSFKGYLYRASKSRATIVYIYGGGCAFPPALDLESYDFGKSLMEQGYSIFVPDYRSGLTFPDNIGQLPRDKSDAILMEATMDELSDIKASIQVLRQQGEQNIFVWGHSFGAYLTNLLATDPSLRGSVKGFISSNGWWIPTHAYGLDFLSPASLRPIDRPVGDLAPILVVHTLDDQRIPVQQVEYFKEWIGSAQNTKSTVAIFPSGGHSYLIKDDFPTDAFLKLVRNFVENLVAL